METKEEIDYEKLPEKAGHSGKIELVDKQNLTEEESNEIKQEYANNLLKNLK